MADFDPPTPSSGVNRHIRRRLRPVLSDTTGRCLHPGTATGRLLVLTEPLSLWGGADPATGRITDARHPQHGEHLTGRVVVMPASRGSSSSASILAEMLRAGVGPAALVMPKADPILVIGALVAHELYGAGIPIVEVAGDDLAAVSRWRHVGIVATTEACAITDETGVALPSATEESRFDEGGAVASDLAERFFASDSAADLRERLASDLALRRNGRAEIFFNLFGVLIDFDAGVVTLEGILESEGEVTFPWVEFRARLSKEAE